MYVLVTTSGAARFRGFFYVLNTRQVLAVGDIFFNHAI